MSRMRILLPTFTFLASILFAACGPPGEGPTQTREPTIVSESPVPTSTATETPTEPMVGAEPLAPLLTGRSATYRGEEVSVADILGDPQEYEGLSLQLIGSVVQLAEARGVLGEPPETEALWAIEDGSGMIYITGVSLPTGPGEDPAGPEVLVIGRVELAPSGEPYVAAAGSMTFGDQGEMFGTARLQEAEVLAAELAAQGYDVRLARIYFGTAQWLSLSERPEQAAIYLNLAFDILENPEQFKGMPGDIPPRTPVHPFPTPPGTLVPQPEGGYRGQ